MGYISHHAIIVTGGIPEKVTEAHATAFELFKGKVSEIIPSGTNGYLSFFVPPDGSKEGWAESEEGNERRAKFREYLRDGERVGYLRWVEINYGDDDHRKSFVASNDDDPEEV